MRSRAWAMPPAAAAWLLTALCAAATVHGPGPAPSGRTLNTATFGNTTGHGTEARPFVATLYRGGGRPAWSLELVRVHLGGAHSAAVAGRAVPARVDLGARAWFVGRVVGDSASSARLHGDPLLDSSRAPLQGVVHTGGASWLIEADAGGGPGAVTMQRTSDVAMVPSTYAECGGHGHATNGSPGAPRDAPPPPRGNSTPTPAGGGAQGAGASSRVRHRGSQRAAGAGGAGASFGGTGVARDRRGGPATAAHTECGVFLDADYSFFLQWRGPCLASPKCPPSTLPVVCLLLPLRPPREA